MTLILGSGREEACVERGVEHQEEGGAALSDPRLSEVTHQRMHYPTLAHSQFRVQTDSIPAQLRVPNELSAILEVSSSVLGGEGWRRGRPHS